MLAVLTLVLLFVSWLALRRLSVGWAEQQKVWGALSYVSLVLAYIDEQWNPLLSPPWGLKLKLGICQIYSTTLEKGEAADDAFVGIASCKGASVWGMGSVTVVVSLPVSV